MRKKLTKLKKGKIRKEYLKLSLFTYCMIVYVENLKESMKKKKNPVIA